KGCNEAGSTQGMTRPWTTWKPLLVNLYSGQARGTLMRHESASPAVPGIKELFIAPKHLQIRSGRFLPKNLIIDVPFPRRRLPGHEIQIKGRWPTENAVTRHNKGLIADGRHGSKTIACIRSEVHTSELQ